MPTWDVTVQFDGPESATDNAAVRFSGTDGTVAQDSGLIINDCSSATFSSTGLAVGGLAVSGLVTTTSDTDGEFVALKLINESDSANTAGFVSLEFDLEDTAGTAVDAGKIAVKKEASFTSTAASQDSMMSFQVSQNGTMTERMTISSAGNVEIGGDLLVSGATTTISSTVTTIADALTIYSFGTTGCSPSNDSGFIVERGGLANVGVIWDESADEFAIVGSTCEDGTTAGDITITAYGNLHALGATLGGDLTVSGGDITLGSSLILSGGDTTSLNLIDAIDATTETTLESALDSLTNLVAVGALAAGSITACFGAIDNGASNITSGGIWSVDIDSASTINASGGGIGAAGSLTLGVGADAGLYVKCDDLYIENKTSNNDLVFRINDGGTFTEVARIVGTVSAMRFAEISTPAQPSGGAGGYLYAKCDGKPYWRSNEIAEVALDSAGGGGVPNPFFFA